MKQPTALISGAGVGGPTLAYWLARGGYAVTVVERAGDLRSSGAPVDVRGEASDVVERMGVLPALRASSTVAKHLRIVDGAGRQVARIPLEGVQGADGRWVELPRGELAANLYRAARDDAEFVFGDGVAALAQDPDGVDVTFERGAPRRFDVVIGADGLHSAVRRLAFGPDADVLRHMGLYVATVFFDDEEPDPSGDVLLYNRPGLALGVHPGVGRPGAALMFRSPPVPGFDHRDSAQHKRLVIDAYAGGGWRTAEVLERVRETDDLYCDAAAAVRLPSWSRGRIGLLGDASSAASFLGDGSSLAIVGADTLAAELTADPGDPAAALRRYETRHRKRTDPIRWQAEVGARLMIPATSTGVAARNAGARLWGAAGSARRRVERCGPVSAGRGTGKR
jgi:2-polyprenyl-6-methoxyphenol hydroxylase-like FAD-dependent oxidoreductase